MACRRRRTGAALMCFALPDDEAEAVREKPSPILKSKAITAPLDVTGALAARLAERKKLKEAVYGARLTRIERALTGDCARLD